MKEDIQIMKANFEEVRTRIDTIESEKTTRIDIIDATMAVQYTNVVNDPGVQILWRIEKHESTIELPENW